MMDNKRIPQMAGTGNVVNNYPASVPYPCAPTYPVNIPNQVYASPPSYSDATTHQLQTGLLPLA